MTGDGSDEVTLLERWLRRLIRKQLLDPGRKVPGDITGKKSNAVEKD